MMMEIVSIFLGVILLCTAQYGYGRGGFEFSRLIFLMDAPSLIILLIFTVPMLLRGGAWKDFRRAWKLLDKKYTSHLSEVRRALDVVEIMQKQVLYAGVISALLTFITILHNLSDFASLGPNLAVAILTMVYAMIFEMLLLPLQLEAKRRIIDYMGVDTEMESGEAAADRMPEEGRAEAGEISGIGKISAAGNLSETGKEYVTEKKEREGAEQQTEDGIKDGRI